MANKKNTDLERIARLLKLQGVALMLLGFLLLVLSVLTIFVSFGVL